ncbi:MAG: cation transporter [Anaerolineae bacterium]|nr:cation transporter [Anaerolineae bacterium]
MDRSKLKRYAWLSIGAAILTIGLKGAAYWLTGSVGLLSDALESIVNLVAAVLALAALTLAARPPDEDHEYGHDKAEYFSSGTEGALILVAAASIIYTSVERLLNPQPIEQVGIGLVVSVAASLVNLVVARVLLRAGRAYESITLEADAHHLMTDVWTSVGVVIGVALVGITGLTWLDPLIALLVALNIVREGTKLVRRSVMGLMDAALPPAELVQIQGVLDRFRAYGIEIHALRTRQAGSRRFITMHVLVPGDWTVQRGHDLLECLEAELGRTLPNLLITAHLEPLEDPASWEDVELVRPENRQAPEIYEMFS